MTACGCSTAEFQKHCLGMANHDQLSLTLKAFVLRRYTHAIGRDINAEQPCNDCALSVIDRSFPSFNHCWNMDYYVCFACVASYVILEELEEVKTREMLTIHGPNSIDSKLTENVQESKGCQRFERRRLCEGAYEDYVCRIGHVILRKGDTKSGTEEKPLDTSCSENGKLDDLDNDHDIAVAYIIKLKPRPPKIDINKCRQLGVPKGPLIGKLSKNETVVLEDGREIQPNDVLIDREETDKKIIVLDCPTEEYIDNMMRSEEFHRCQPPQEDERELTELIIHMSPLAVTQNVRYKDFLNRFGSETRHIFLHENTCPYMYESLYRYSAKLNLISSRLFPQLLPGVDSMEAAQDQSEQYIQGHPEMAYHIRGKHGLDLSMCVKCDYKRFQEECLQEIPNLHGKIQEVYSRLQADKVINGCSNRFPEIVFMGTTSACPATYRNVSCILVHTSESSAILLDCGGGSTSQLYQFYGQNFNHVITKIKAGLIGFIKRRRKAFADIGKDYEPLWLAIPYNYWQWWLRIYNDIDPIMDHCRKIPLKDLNGQDIKVVQQFLQEVDVAKFEPVLVHHCRDAYGLVVTMKDGCKVVYSGDTMPCEALIQTGEECDILIHECTFEDYLESYATIKKHSTQSQAIEVGRRMRAKYIILTHFSARYQPFYHLNNAPDNVFAAFDFMRITLDDLPLLKYVKEILPVAFAEEITELEKKEQKFRKREAEGRINSKYKQLCAKNGNTSEKRKDCDTQNNSKNLNTQTDSKKLKTEQNGNS
ncbi:hypothetical protein FSP39_015897 [Pinctada imbricata]|uniref:ribonuclease Z n=1 Tax=Pinctada imbricata TaxID=66713 RepID=A0AA89BU55_PINIB|nr:hypothetical protein FSP39_015897 [Pinctada imbricata]